MPSNAQKTPFIKTISESTRVRVAGQISLLGRGIPASIVSLAGWIAVIQFEVQTPGYSLPHITVPVSGNAYTYVPLQPGDMGVVRPSDAFLGGISGLGTTSAATMAMPGNLGALVFDPVGNKSWAPTDANTWEAWGPNGSILRNKGGTAKVYLDENGNVNITGTLIINGNAYLSHLHTGVQTGTSKSGPVST